MKRKSFEDIASEIGIPVGVLKQFAAPGHEEAADILDKEREGGSLSIEIEGRAALFALVTFVGSLLIYLVTPETFHHDSHPVLAAIGVMVLLFVLPYIVFFLGKRFLRKKYAAVLREMPTTEEAEKAREFLALWEVDMAPLGRLKGFIPEDVTSLSPVDLLFIVNRHLESIRWIHRDLRNVRPKGDLSLALYEKELEVVKRRIGEYVDVELYRAYLFAFKQAEEDYKSYLSRLGQSEDGDGFRIGLVNMADT